MADSKKKRTKTSGTTGSKDNMKEESSTLGEIESSIDEIAMLDFVQSTKEELKKLGETLHEAADKGLVVAKNIAEDVKKFSKDATDMTKIKLELHNMKDEREKSYASMGRQLRKLNKAKNLRDIKAKFRKDFAKLDELESDIKRKEKQVSKITLLKQAKRRTSKS